MEDLVELIEVWQPVETGGESVREDGSHLKRVALIVSGSPVFLEKDYCIERRFISKEQAKLLVQHNKA